MTGIREFSTTAASNLDIGGISQAEGMSRASVNNAMRQRDAETAKLLLDMGGATTTTGSSNAYLLTLPTAPSAYANNLFFLATSNHSNTGPATINVNSIGVRDIEKTLNGAAAPLVSGDFPSGHIGVFTYSSGNNSVMLLNPVHTVASSYSTKIHLIDHMTDVQRAGLDPAGSGVYIDTIFSDIMAGIVQVPFYGGAEIIFPHGKMRFASTVHLKKQVKLIGESMGGSGNFPTWIIFDDNIDGFVVHLSNTGAGGVEAATTAATGTHFEGLTINQAQARTSTAGSAIWMRGHATVRDCQFNWWGEHGIKIVASIGGGAFLEGNDNGWQVQNVRIYQCKLDGVHVQGLDTNAGTGIAIDVTDCDGWGLYDESFLGNTWVGCMMHSNALGPYTTTHPSSRSVFIGCYTEADQPTAVCTSRTIIIGALQGANVDGGLRLFDGNITPFSVANTLATTSRTIRINTSTSSAIDLAMGDDPARLWSFAWFDETSKEVQWRHNGGGTIANMPLRLTTTTSTATDESSVSLGAGKLIIPGVWVPSLTAGKYYRLNFQDVGRRFQQQTITDAHFTLTPQTSPYHTLCDGALTSNRTVTLSTTNAVAGTSFKVTRTATGASFNVNVGTGPLKALAANTWCEVTYNGSAYYLSAYGAL